MPNLQSVLKEEITRIARKEAKKLSEPLRKQVSTQRRDIAELKRQCADLMRGQSVINKAAKKSSGPAPHERLSEVVDATTAKARFSPSRLALMRERFELSAEALGPLLNVSGQTVRNWEKEVSRPKPEQVQRLAQIRKLGKRGVQELIGASA
jgi:DNA-binding transcriptional regulator YiaG